MSDEFYAAFLPELADVLERRPDVVAVERRNVYTLGAELTSGQWVEVAVQWQPEKPK